MTVKIGINGFGRIGRNIFRALSRDAAFAGEMMHFCNIRKSH
jgi:glyceraldehyde 3-phosphate dehydrogenase